MLGIGIGIIVATLLMSTLNNNKQYTDEQIIQKAKDLGMQFPEDFKVISKEVK